MQLRIESVKPQHAETYRETGEVRVNNLPFTIVEGRLVTAPISEAEAAMFEGVKGFVILREDLSVVKPTGPTAPASIQETPAPERVPTIGGRPVTAQAPDGQTVGGQPVNPESADASTEAGTPGAPESPATPPDTSTSSQEGGQDAGDGVTTSEQSTGPVQEGAPPPAAAIADRAEELTRFTINDLRKAAKGFDLKTQQLDKAQLAAAIAVAELEHSRAADLPKD